MQVTIPVIRIHTTDKKYVLTQEDLSLVKSLVWAAKSTDTKTTDKNLAELLDSKLKFKNKKAFKLTISALDIDPTDVKVTSAIHDLSAWNVHYMENLVKCAAQHPNSILILPNYVKVGEVGKAKPVKTKAKPKLKKKDK